MHRFVFGLLISAALGCALPPPTSLPSQRTETSPNLNTLTAQHPLLPKITVDLSNGMTPDEAALIAIACNPDLRALREERGLAEAALLTAGLLPNPTLSLSADLPLFGATDGTNLASSATMSLDLSSFLRRALFVDSAKAHVEQVALDIAWREWEVAEEAKRLAWRVFYLSQKSARTKENEALLQTSYELLLQAMRLGEKTVLESSAAEVAWRDAREATFLAGAAEREAMGQLKQAIGLTEALPQLQQDLSPAWEAPEAAALFVGLEERRLDLVALRYAYDSEDAALRSAVQQSFPALGLDVTAARDNAALNLVGAALQIELPVFQKNQGAIQAEKVTKQQLADEYAARRYEARQQLEQLTAALKSTLAYRDLVNEAIPPLEALNQSYQRAAAGGYVDILSRYAAQEQLAQKRLSLIDIELTLSELSVALELVSGGALPVKP